MHLRSRFSLYLHCTAAMVALLLSVAMLNPLFARAEKKVKPPRENRRADSHEIENLEAQWRSALIKGDPSVIEGMLADDFLGISSTGTLSDKQQYLHRISARVNQFSTIDLVDLKVRVQPTSAIAVSQAHVVGSIDGHTVDGTFRYTKVYGRSPAGQWRVLNFEATRVSGPSMGGEDMKRGLPLNGSPAAKKSR